ncbi:MAG TPA: PDZ domain-containing protein, partial [Epsilonproteobacteria bacterium]|nr:PDZ domain-containing protein [Campylobacterota bacterium]
VGDIVFAIGNPFGVGESVTQGIISAVGKNAIGINRYENFIQTDASINPGNSGGALVDSRGVLIGINTAILSRSGGNHGIGFSIPVDMMQNVVSQLAKSGKVSRGYLGVNLSSLTPELKPLYKESKGAVVTNVQVDSVAYKAGIQRGDLIIQVDKTPIDSPLTLQRVIGEKEPKSTIRITLERNKKKETISLTLGSQDELAEATSNERILQGATLSTLTPQLRNELRLRPDTKGVAVVQVKPNSQAQKDGLQAGDVIIQVENKSITSLQDLRQALAPKKPKRVYLSRGGAIILIVVS